MKQKKKVKLRTLCVFIMVESTRRAKYVDRMPNDWYHGMSIRSYPSDLIEVGLVKSEQHLELFPG